MRIGKENWATMINLKGEWDDIQNQLAKAHKQVNDLASALKNEKGNSQRLKTEL